jgi:hypothetical protein
LSGARAGRAPLALRAERLLLALASTPPRQLLRRAGLTARLRLAPRLGRHDDRRPAPPLAAAMPAPPLPPRPDRIARSGGGGGPGEGWRLRLPWGEAALPEPLPWRPAGPGPEAAAVANNLQYMEFLESLGDADLGAFAAAWIDANPLAAPGATRFAWRPYNLSLRAASWARELARRGDRLDPALRGRMAASLGAQLRFLAAHLETDLRGNHLVKNLKALLWGGAVSPGRRRTAGGPSARGCSSRSWPSRSCPTAATTSARRPTTARSWPTCSSAAPCSRPGACATGSTTPSPAWPGPPSSSPTPATACRRASTTAA